jgi:hypothetical protein
MDWEIERRASVVHYLNDYLPQPIHLAAPSAIAQSPSAVMLGETDSDDERRDNWTHKRALDRVTGFERALW